MSQAPIVAIHPDVARPENCSYPRWRETLERLGARVREVDVFRDNFIHRLEGCDGFMWRYSHGAREMEIARRVFPVAEALGLQCYPDYPTRWHFDDKVAQALLLKAKGLPIPPSRVFFREEEALEYFDSAKYPLVIKLAGGAGSENVRLLKDSREAKNFARILFGQGFLAFPKNLVPRSKGDMRALVALAARRLRLIDPSRHENWLPHRNYMLVQEFLPDNTFDTRITVIGNRAFGFRRFNRPGDFRSSGSGRIDHDPAKIDLASVTLAFEAAKALGTQSLAIDGLRHGELRVIGEISYTYMSNAVRSCPGYWDQSLKWYPTEMWPEEAQATDFFERLTFRSS